MVSSGITKAAFARPSIMLLSFPETGNHCLNVTSLVQQSSESIHIQNPIWSLQNLKVISKSGMGVSGKTTLGRMVPSFGDTIFILKIRTLVQIEWEILIFEDGPFHLIIPIILNRAQWGKDVNINILPNDFYMIKFMSNEEKWQAKNKGPYILDSIEVHVIEWQPNFNPRTHVLPDSKKSYSCMQFHIEENLQSEPPISTDTGEDFRNEIHENKNIPLTEATPLNIAPPSSNQSEIQQDLVMLLKRLKP
ncbi:hypothetical protein SUGI_0070220 [Cryptomeria japonica]|nr:hypothetical protein SUGI_0070220 [Cryptomeria japonica]